MDPTVLSDRPGLRRGSRFLQFLTDVYVCGGIRSANGRSNSSPPRIGSHDRATCVVI